MDILSINKFYWKKGGSETVFFGEKALLEDAGHRVIPFSMRSPENLPSPYSEFFVEEVDYAAPGLKDRLGAALKIIYSFEARTKMEALLAKHRVDVAHFHIFQHQISPSVFGPLQQRGVPLILTLHDLKPLCPNYQMYTQGTVCERCKGRRFYNAFLHSCTKGSRFKSLINTVEMYLHYALGYYQSVNRYIAVSRFYRDKMIEFGFPENQVAYLPNFLDVEKFSPSGEDHGYAIFFGRLSREKGIETLLDAALTTPDIPLKIVGTGPLENELREKTAQAKAQHIEFLGFKTGDELHSLVTNASFSVIPSAWYENCPMSVLESHALETPVLGARIGGIPELISEDVDGVTFTSGDTKALTDKMRYLWAKGGEERLDMGRQGRRKIAEKHHPARHLEQLVEIYKNAILECKGGKG